MIYQLERLIVTIYIIGSAGLYSNLLTSAENSSAESGTSSAFMIAWVLTNSFSMLFYIAAVRKKVHPIDLVAAAFGTLILSGFLWSEMATQTFRLSVLVVLNIAFAWALAKRYAVEVVIQILTNSLTGMVILGLALAVIGWPNAFWNDGWSRDSFLGTLPVQGLFSHKIYAGFYSAQAFVLNFVLRRGAWRLSACAACFIGVLAAGSAIGLSALMIGLVAVMFFKILRTSAARVVGSSFVLVASVAVVALWSPIANESLALLGRDPTLSGRTNIWTFAVQFWTERPLFGWAYGGIFGDSPDAPGNIVRVTKYYSPPHFHNGFLQVLTELGSLGFILFSSLFSYMIYNVLKNAWTLSRKVDRAAASLAIMTLAVMPVMNIGLRYNELSTIMMMYFAMASHLEKFRTFVATRSNSGAPLPSPADSISH